MPFCQFQHFITKYLLFFRKGGLHRKASGSNQPKDSKFIVSMHLIVNQLDFFGFPTPPTSNVSFGQFLKGRSWQVVRENK